jgi:hypothetical protein
MPGRSAEELFSRFLDETQQSHGALLGVNIDESATLAARCTAGL